MSMLAEPKDVLHPASFTVEAAEKWALDRAAALPEDLFRLTSLWSIHFVRQPAPFERKTRYLMRMAQSQNYGMATAPAGLRDPSAEIVGLDARAILKRKLYGSYVDRTALVDLVMAHVSRPADCEKRLEAGFHAKYEARSELFAQETEAILKRKRLKNATGPCVLVIGSTAGIVGALARRGFRVLATDLSKPVLGRELGGLKVKNGREANTRGMKEADLAILTGMTLPNRSLRGLMTLAKTHNTSTLIWAISGRNFGHYYTAHGIDCVISDPSPFLPLPGPATMAIWRRGPAVPG